MSGQSRPVSEPEYEVRLDRRVRMPMSDGVELAAVVARPDAGGGVSGDRRVQPLPPAARYRSRRLRERLRPPPARARLVRPPRLRRRLLRRRGTGNSGGSSTDIYSERERRDGYEAVEWVAAQPWCSGAVGMWGMSYGGVVQWQVAAQRPPHLRTLVMGSSNTDVYLDWTHPGGSIRPYMFDSYSPLMTAYNFAPPMSRSPVRCGRAVAGAPGEQRPLGNRLHLPSASGSLLEGAFPGAGLRPHRGPGAVLVRLGRSLPYPDPAGFLPARRPQENPAWSVGPLLAEDALPGPRSTSATRC